MPYVLKTDDDVYVNVRNLLKFVVENRKPNLLVGTLQCGAVPIRDPHNKWYAPRYMIGAAVYPNYLSGTAYLMSRSMAQVKITSVVMTLKIELYRAAKNSSHVVR